MGREREERRRVLRMGLDCPARCRLPETGEELEVRVLDLSSEGVGLVFDRSLAPGSRFELRIVPERSLVPPLHALAEVVHVHAGESGCRTGARILQILD